MVINDCPRSRATGPGLKRVGGGTNLAMSSLSLPPGDLEDSVDLEIKFWLDLGDLCDLKTRFCLGLKYE